MQISSTLKRIIDLGHKYDPVVYGSRLTPFGDWLENLLIGPFLKELPEHWEDW